MTFFISFSASAQDYNNRHRNKNRNNHNHNWNRNGNVVGAPLDGGLLTVLGAAGVAYFVSRKKKKNGEII